MYRNDPAYRTVNLKPPCSSIKSLSHWRFKNESFKANKRAQFKGNGANEFCNISPRLFAFKSKFTAYIDTQETLLWLEQKSVW